ncbi:ATP-binding protein [Spirillospora sp. NPDC049024]
MRAGRHRQHAGQCVRHGRRPQRAPHAGRFGRRCPRPFLAELVPADHTRGGGVVGDTAHGPGVQPNRLPQRAVVDPGRDRLPAPDARDRSGGRSGYGLGLAIVNAVAQAHRATLTTVARPEGGLAITVRFARPSPGTPLRQEDGGSKSAS